MNDTAARRGQSELLYIIVIVLIVVVVALFLYGTRAEQTVRTAEQFGSAEVRYESDVHLENLHDLSLIVPRQQNPDLVQVLVYACGVGDESGGFNYTRSTTLPIKFRTEDDIESVMDEIIVGQYYLEMECDEDGDRVLEVGSEPGPDVDNVVVTRILVPRIEGGVTTARLHRWFE